MNPSRIQISAGFSESESEPIAFTKSLQVLRIDPERIIQKRCLSLYTEPLHVLINAACYARARVSAAICVSVCSHMRHCAHAFLL